MSTNNEEFYVTFDPTKVAPPKPPVDTRDFNISAFASVVLCTLFLALLLVISATVNAMIGGGDGASDTGTSTSVDQSCYDSNVAEGRSLAREQGASASDGEALARAYCGIAK